MTYLQMDADISEDRLYRYWLSRRWSMGNRTVMFVGLNPSTADASQDDPTIRRCVGFARQWGFDRLYMCNVCAYRSTDPKALRHVPDPVGPANRETLELLVGEAELIVAAWGKENLTGPGRWLARWILSLPQTRCLGKNKDGTPKHPLYLAANTELQPVIAAG